MRGYFLLVVAAGFVGALAGHLPSATSARSRTELTGVFADAQGDKVHRIAELKARDEPQITSTGGSVELTRDANGYFYADVKINGAPVHMLIDTGATVIALSREDARMAGIATSIAMNDVIGQGADGAVKGEEVRLDRVTLGGTSAQGLPAIVLSNGGQSLLGQSFLSKFASVHIAGDKMVLS